MGEETLQPAHPHPFLLQLQVSRKEGGREGGREGEEVRREVCTWWDSAATSLREMN